MGVTSQHCSKVEDNVIEVFQEVWPMCLSVCVCVSVCVGLGYYIHTCTHVYTLRPVIFATR